MKSIISYCNCLILTTVILIWCNIVHEVYSDSNENDENSPKILIPNYMGFLGSRKETVWNKKPFLIFHDIKYGTLNPDNRFAKSTPYAPHEDELTDGTTKSIYCPSLETLKDIEVSSNEINEDCLFLTISTKNKTGNSPVMVHLGGYNIIERDNSNDDANPGFLLEEDIVLVSVQYRVGPFGFLSTDTKEIPGNVGIHDIIEALRWVQKYISYFGGNPKNVVLFGQFHSAAIIHILTMTPLLEKEELFHKVIYQSGSALMPKFINQNSTEMIKEISKHLEIESENIDDINGGLKRASAQSLLEAYKKYVDEFSTKQIPLIVIGDKNGVLPEDPKVLLKKRKYRAYPSLGGSVEQPSTCAIEFLGSLGTSSPKESSSSSNKKDSSDESSEELSDEHISKKDHSDENLEKDIEGAANIFRDILILDVPTNGEQAEYISNLFPKKIFAANFLKNIAPTVMDMFSIPIKAATLDALKYNTENGGLSYLYAFNYNPNESRLSCQDNVYVVQLTDDDIFLFPQKLDNLKRLSKKETLLARLMVEMWTSFAANGKPEAHSLYDWPKMQLGLNGPYLIIDSIHKVGFDYTEEYFSGLKHQRNKVNVIEL